MQFIDLIKDPGAEIPRPQPEEAPTEAVRGIIERVKSGGDRALVELTQELDGVSVEVGDLVVTAEEIDAAAASTPPEVIEALEEIERRIRHFAQNQLMLPWREHLAGGTVGEAVYAVDRVGIYVPGGRASYPSTALMCSVPASVAGVGSIAMCVPPGEDGKVPDATLAAAQVAGVDEVYRVGGAQAIAALAFGTETIPKVDVVAGPGNRFVAEAKREIAGVVAIDSVAGPSEIAVIADGNADSRVIALDLISQAEHGPGGAFTVVSWDESVLRSVEAELKSVLDEINASGEIRGALEKGGSLVLASDRDAAFEALSRFAPEHLEIMCEDAEDLVDMVRNAGAIFVGQYSPVSLGDYAAGSNHVLPTGGTARWASGLRASHFQRTAAVVWFDHGSLEHSAQYVQVMSEAEGLPNHSRAVEARLSDDGSR
jgi:histidinol dehydrogenase